VVGQRGKKKTLGWLQSSGGRDDRRGPSAGAKSHWVDFITSVVTQKATESDDAGLELTLGSSSSRRAGKAGRALPSTGAYISGAHLKSAIEQNYELVGPAQPSAGRANIPEAYRIEAFTIDIAKRQAICPGGFYNTQCSRLEGKRKSSGQVPFRVEHSLPWLARSSPNASGLSKGIEPL